jgi:hypothetical protein
MSRPSAPADDEAPEEDSLRWQRMENTLSLRDSYSVARASEREGWRGADGAASALIKLALESVGVSSQAIHSL